MMRHSLAAIAALLFMSCSGQDKAANGSAEDNSGASGSGDGSNAALASFQPGQWETTVEILQVSMPNMPQGMAAPRPTQGPGTVSYCLTAEQAARPRADFLTGSGDTGGCTYQNFSMEGGRLQGVVQCDRQGTTMRSTLNGRFTATSYELSTQVQTTASGRTMNMDMRTTGRRVGDCPG